MGRTAFGWLIAVSAVAGPLFYYGYWREEAIAVTASTLSRGKVEQTVSAISAGTVKPKLESMVASALMGKIKDIPKKEGARVSKGDLLIEMDHAEFDAQVELAEANLRAGQFKLEQAKIGSRIADEVAATGLSQAAAQLAQAQRNLERIQALLDQQAISQSEMDKVNLAYRVAKEDHAAALANQQQNLVRQEEIKSAGASIEQLESAVDVARETREKAFVRAPFGGVVAKVNVEMGEAVAMGMPLLKLVEDSDFFVQAPFDEANASQIQIGQKARVNVDAYRGTDFAGEVTFISPTVTLNPDLSRTLDIDVRIAEGKDKFVAGMSADVVIIVQQKDDVLFVPSEALVREETAYVIENGRAVRREVRVGIGNTYTREVLGGLKEGETLLTSVTEKGLRDGVRVLVVDSLDDL
ncbi:MAG: efflux RND transporter periplasmic adaptor subunit [Candidatus Hydrogenedentes bacterium]|nr:efflux RND transporter periplasmic adaptor subunit [Candidatus Hydrogenedentota bacterium]